jgi:hypothetical protein
MFKVFSLSPPVPQISMIWLVRYWSIDGLIACFCKGCLVFIVCFVFVFLIRHYNFYIKFCN